MTTFTLPATDCPQMAALMAVEVIKAEVQAAGMSPLTSIRERIDGRSAGHKPTHSADWMSRGDQRG